MGAEVAETIVAATHAGANWRLLGFLDDATNLPDRILGLPVLGPIEWLAEHSEVQVALAIGHPRTRQQVVRRVEALGNRWATVTHPTCIVAPSAEVGEGATLFAGCTLSSRARLARLSHLHYQVVVSHDAAVGELGCVMAHVTLSGGVKVGEGAFVGVGVSTRQGVSIGPWSLIGAGASVVRDIPPCCVAVGVPAKPIRFYDGPGHMPPF
jgi:sugar O-acyltransferase (sialic acid O-acetyltransferase NeuD family)